VSEVLGEHWLEEAVEDDLSTAGLREGQPEDGNKLESIIKWEPVNGVNSALKDSQERIDDPVCQPLAIISSACGEQSMQRVICRNDETDGVDQKFSSNIEENQEKVESTKTKYNVDLGDTSLLLKLVHILIFS